MEQSVADRIAKIRELAEDKSATEAERESAWAFFDRMVEKYPEYRDRETAKNQEVIERDISWSKGYHHELLLRISSFLGLEAFNLHDRIRQKKIKKLRIKGPVAMVQLCERMYQDLRKEQSKALFSFGLGFAWSVVPWCPSDENFKKSNSKRWTQKQRDIAQAGREAGEGHQVQSPRTLLGEC